MGDYFKDLMKQGKQLLADTKTPKQMHPIVKKEKTLPGQSNTGTMYGKKEVIPVSIPWVRFLKNTEQNWHHWMLPPRRNG